MLGLKACATTARSTKLPSPQRETGLQLLENPSDLQKAFLSVCLAVSISSSLVCFVCLLLFIICRKVPGFVFFLSFRCLLVCAVGDSYVHMCLAHAWRRGKLAGARSLSCLRVLEMRLKLSGLWQISPAKPSLPILSFLLF